jgi:protein-tyrosine phosphatase
MTRIKNNFGSYRDYVVHLKTRLALAAGVYSSLQKIEWSGIRRLIFVCKGNVCRSPYAEARARLMGFPAASFGLETAGNGPANPAALRNATVRGVDLSGHRSSPMDTRELTFQDLVLVFEPRQVMRLHSLSLGMSLPPLPHVSLLGLWEPGYRRPLIADPYGRSDEYFQVCFDRIDASVNSIIERIRCSQ